MPLMKKTKRKTNRRAKVRVTPATADDLLPQLEAALTLSGMSQTRFGYLHFGDPAFFKKLREGRKLYGLRAKAEALIAEYGV